jgi:hypothetical protein
MSSSSIPPSPSSGDYPSPTYSDTANNDEDMIGGDMNGEAPSPTQSDPGVPEGYWSHFGDAYGNDGDETHDTQSQLSWESHHKVGYTAARILDNVGTGGV